MGGDLPAPPSADSSPRFAIWAARDTGTDDHPGTPLQRTQIVKLWVENGAARERVYDVAGDASNGASVDRATCTPRGAGADTLCATWRDPDSTRTRTRSLRARRRESVVSLDAVGLQRAQGRLQRGRSRRTRSLLRSVGADDDQERRDFTDLVDARSGRLAGDRGAGGGGP
jgi:hypothetical protein